MATLYAITDDIKAISDLLENMVDENGDPREPTEDEMQTLKEWYTVSNSDFEKKFDSYCKYIKNLKLQASNVEAERKNYKTELDRLSKRAKAFENRSKFLNNLLRFSMDNLHMEGYKTDLFSAKIQNTQISIEALAGASIDDIPEEFLKPRELNTTAIKEAIKAGKIVQGDGSPLHQSHLYFKDTGKELKNVIWTQGTALVIR